MTDLESLHRAILEDSVDDTRRLVYADALDESGKPRHRARAELIRAQIQHHQIREAIGGGHVGALDVIEDRVLKRWGESFLPEPLRRRDASYPALNVVANVFSDNILNDCIEFRRGFIAAYHCELMWHPDNLPLSLERLRGHVRAIFAWNPLESITISFEGFPPMILTAEITNGHPWAALDSPGTAWRIGWDMRTYETWPHDAIASPLTCATRAELGRELSGWLTAALRVPHEYVLQERTREEEEQNRVYEEMTQPVTDPQNYGV